MKHLITLLFVAILFGSIHAQTQEERVSLRIKNLSLEEAFTELENKTGYAFSYISEFIPETRIKKRYKDQSLKSILTNLLENHDLLFKIQDQTILIFRDLDKWKSKRQKAIYGNVVDALSGEFLIGANIFSSSGKGVISNDYGYYAIELLSETDSMLNISYVGYHKLQIPYGLIKEGLNTFRLKQDTTLFDPVVITKKDASTVFQQKVGEHSINQSDAYRHTSISGEGDVINRVANIPGIVKLSEGKSGYTVHGASSDHNLILIDEAPVYNPSHALGFVSVFNTEAVNSGRLYKSYISPQYGGRLASVLSMYTREGNDRQLSSTLVSNTQYSGLTLEGPLIKKKLSFLVSGRISHFNWILDRINFEDQFYTPDKIDFYDLHAKLNFNLGKNNRIFFSTFINEDEIVPKKDELNSIFFGTYWKNRTLSLRWNRLWGNKLFSNMSFILSEYRFQVFNDFVEDPYDLSVVSNINNVNLKLDFNYYPNDKNQLKFGSNIQRYNFNPAAGFLKIVQPFDSTINYKIPEKISLENSLFIEHVYKIKEDLKLSSGLRFTNFMNIGNDNEEYEFDIFGSIIQTDFYKKGEIIRSYNSLEPRISLQYMPIKDIELGLAYSRTTQNLFRLINDNPNNPTETWIPAGKHLKPMKADGFHIYVQYSKSAEWKLSTGLFYFHAKNVATYKDGANLFVAENLEQQIAQGRLQSHGVFLDVEYNLPRFKTKASYTYTLARQKYKKINNGNWFNASHDFTHAISLNGNYLLTKNMVFNFNWQYNSGNFVSLPDRFIYYNRFPFPIYEQRNNYRLPAYHRLDISLVCNILRREKFDLELTGGAYNLYGRLNPFQVNVDFTDNKANLKIFALTSTVPFLNLKMKFHSAQ